MEVIMALIRRSEMVPTWEHVFNDLFNTELIDWSHRHYSDTNTTLPSVNILENEDGFAVEMAAPGMEKKDFKIEVNNGNLTISSEKQSENKTENKKGKITKQEFCYQSFSRSFTLPLVADTDKITAEYDNGILHVAIPKREEAKPKPVKQIDIK
jgi:HSP20 family protein